MPKNKIEDLRNHLFETIEKLGDDEKPMDLARAKAVAEVAQVIINSAKLEIDLIHALGKGTQVESSFMPTKQLSEKNG